MRVFLVVDETVFFHPDFVHSFLERTKDEVVGVCLVTGIKKKNNIERYIITHFYNLKLIEIIKLGYRQIKYLILDKIDSEKDYTVRSVLERAHVLYKEVKYNINTEENLEYIRNCEPDVIISSQSLYFGKNLLRIPKLCCINRHSGLLPRNGGLWPGFQAVRKGERETGVSVHLMNSDIDSGKVLTQIKVKITEGQSLWEIYEKCFRMSVDAVLQALDKIRENDYTPVENGYEKEYYSFPTQEQWKEFREHKGRYV